MISACLDVLCIQFELEITYFFCVILKKTALSLNVTKGLITLYSSNIRARVIKLGESFSLFYLII